MSPQTLDRIADAVDPLLALIALAAPFIQPPGGGPRRSPWRAWAGSALALALIYLVQFADARLVLWGRAGMDYSTHTAFATALMTAVALGDRRWLWLFVPLLVGHAWLILHLQYHSFADVWTAGLVGVLVGWVGWVGGRQLLSAPRQLT